MVPYIGAITTIRLIHGIDWPMNARTDGFLVREIGTCFHKSLLKPLIAFPRILSLNDFVTHALPKLLPNSKFRKDFLLCPPGLLLTWDDP